MNVIVTGSLGYDYIMDFPGRFADRIMPDKIHKLSLSFLVGKLTKQFGGTGANIAYTLKLLGVEPRLLACAGDDFEEYQKHLTSHDISTNGISVHKTERTSAYFVITDQDDNQIGSFYVGAMKYAKDLSIRSHLKGGRQARSAPHDSFQVKPFVVIAPTDPKAMVKYVNECRSVNIPYLYDPAFQIATFTPDELRDGIEGAALLIGNDYEIALIEDRLGVSHEELLRLTPVVITTLGAKGSIIETKREAIHVKPAKALNTSDPTGAGDAYRAGFLAGYLRRFDLAVCGQMGSVAAVYTVETYGTQTHTFTKNEFINRYKENYGKELIL